VAIAVKFTATTAGAVVTPLIDAKYIKSIVKGTTGFVITFKDKWAGFQGFCGSILPVAYDATRATNIKEAANGVASNPSTLTFLVTNGAGTAVDLTTGDTVTMMLFMSYKKKV
jgi:hypothetical protein